MTQLSGERIKQVLKLAILLGLGLYFTQTIATGALGNYINPQWTWLTWIAVGLFFLLALVAGSAFLTGSQHRQPVKAHGRVATDGERAAHGHETQHDAHSHDHAAHDGTNDGHTHPAVRWPVLALLVVPLAIGVGVPSRPLGASALNSNTGSAASFMEKSGAAHDDPIRWNIWDWQRTYHANIHPDAWFNGQQADMTGFVFHPEGLPADQFVLARYVMRHCAADAFGVGMLVKWPGGAELPTDTWVRVQGTMMVEPFDGENVLLISAQNLDDRIGTPATAYIYPTFYAIPR